MATIELRLYFKAVAGVSCYKHKRGKENKQTTKLQDWLDEWGQGVPPEITDFIKARNAKS